MREIVLDTETTGLDPNQGHRLVEVGCVELLNRIPTGLTFHAYVNPERDMPFEAFNVHGLSAEFLSQHKRFHEIVDEFIAFIGDDTPLVIHNAEFDHKFLCAELKLAKRGLIARERLVDTLALARRKHSAGPQPRRTMWPLRHRQFPAHQARRAARRRNPRRGLSGIARWPAGLAQSGRNRIADRDSVGGGGAVRARPAPLKPRLTEAELAAHREFVATLGEAPIWNSYSGSGT